MIRLLEAWQERGWARAFAILFMILVVGAATGEWALAKTGPGEPPLVVKGRLVDGTGGEPIADGVVIIDGEWITCAGAAAECVIPAGARVLDAGAGTILPGLIDLHVHTAPHYLWMYLAAGVTTVRDLSNEIETLESLGRDGPGRARLLWSGPLLDGPQSVLHQIALDAATPEAARESVDNLAAWGVDVVKLYEQIPASAYQAAAARAQEHGLPVATDLGLQITRGLGGAEVDALQALEAGVTSIEHMSGFALAYHRLGGDPASAHLDPVLIDSLARAVVGSGAAVVPTLILATNFAEESLSFASDILLFEELPDGMADWWTGLHGSITEEVRARAIADQRLSMALVRRIHELGGRIGAGSDTPAGPFDIPGGGLHRELELLVEAGLSPLEAIRAATGEAARILSRPDLGILAVGKAADLIIVTGNPAEDITATREIEIVVRGGRAYSKDELITMGVEATTTLDDAE